MQVTFWKQIWPVDINVVLGAIFVVARPLKQHVKQTFKTTCKTFRRLTEVNYVNKRH